MTLGIVVERSVGHRRVFSCFCSFFLHSCLFVLAFSFVCPPCRCPSPLLLVLSTACPGLSWLLSVCHSKRSSLAYFFGAHP